SALSSRSSELVLISRFHGASLPSNGHSGTARIPSLVPMNLAFLPRACACTCSDAAQLRFVSSWSMILSASCSLFRNGASAASLTLVVLRVRYAACRHIGWQNSASARLGMNLVLQCLQTRRMKFCPVVEWGTQDATLTVDGLPLTQREGRTLMYGE